MTESSEQKQMNEPDGSGQERQVSGGGNGERAPKSTQQPALWPPSENQHDLWEGKMNLKERKPQTDHVYFLVTFTSCRETTFTPESRCSLASWPEGGYALSTIFTRLTPRQALTVGLEAGAHPKQEGD